LLVELRDKLQLPVLDSLSDKSSAMGSAITDVRDALAGLGYSTDEIRDVLRELPADLGAEGLLRQALNLLGARRA
jgi:Holliday junction resolvasome RuvABC DNA-binding subunit